MNILIITFEDGRWGPSRLVKPLTQAGFQVAALCPTSNAVAKSGFLARYFPLTSVKSSRHLAQRLATVMAMWKPEFIIPGDERTVACLHALVRRGRLDAATQAVLIASLGNPARFDAMLLKSHTLELARSLGVLVPAGAMIAAPDAAVAEAGRIGYPCYVKTAFSWAGQGVTRCETEPDIRAAVAGARPTGGASWRDTVRRLLHRDWYPTPGAIDIQQAIAGEPAMYCALAMAGTLVAGFAGHTKQASSATGPSSVVTIGPDAAMEQAAATMIAGLGASGFIGFDFMIETGTGRAYLLECNPRPIQVGHLGARIGVDLCAALAAALHHRAGAAATASGHATVALFPQEWARNPAGGADGHDVPWDDPSLLAAMVMASQNANSSAIILPN